MTPKEILNKATEINGCVEQSLQAMEECGELIQAINKLRRLGGITFDKIRKPNKNDTQKYCFAYHDLCGEIADVKIMIEQLISMTDLETVELIEERKITRLAKRLKL